MTTIQKVAASSRAFMKGEISEHALAVQHQKWALEQFPESKTVGEALNKWLGTAVGARAISEMQMIKSVLLNEHVRSGDGDLDVFKHKAADEAVEKGEAAISHHKPSRAGRAVDTGDGDDVGESGADVPSPQNAASYAHELAQKCARENKISLDDAYTKLLKTKYFQLVMQAAKLGGYSSNSTSQQPSAGLS